MDAVNAEEIEGQNILIVEDMIDSGLTMKKFCESIKICKPKSLKMAIWLYKKNPVNLTLGLKADYLGFWIPDKFVIGYGMDYN